MFILKYRLRSQLNSLQEASGGKRISVNDLVIKVSSLFTHLFFLFFFWVFVWINHFVYFLMLPLILRIHVNCILPENMRDFCSTEVNNIILGI